MNNIIWLAIEIVYIYIYIVYVYIYIYIHTYIPVQCLYLISIKSNIKSLLPIHDWMESKKLLQYIKHFATELDADNFLFLYIHIKNE